MARSKRQTKKAPPSSYVKRTMWDPKPAKKHFLGKSGVLKWAMRPDQIARALHESANESGDFTIVVETKFGKIETKVHSFVVIPFFETWCDGLEHEPTCLNLQDDLAPPTTDKTSYQNALREFLKIPYGQKEDSAFFYCKVLPAYFVMNAFSYKEKMTVLKESFLGRVGSVNELFEFIDETWDFFFCNEGLRKSFVQHFGKDFQNHGLWMKHSKRYKALHKSVYEGSSPSIKDLQIFMMVNDIFYQQDFQHCEDCNTDYIGDAHRCDDW